MKTTSTILALCLAVAAAQADAEPARKDAAAARPGGGTISVDIANLKSGGSVLVALFDGPKGFPSFKGQFAARRIAVSGSVAKVVFERIPSGRYAIAVVHDENDNGRLDTRLGVIPAEPIGFSNNAKIGRFGPPSFEAAAFDVTSRQRNVRIAVE